MTPECFSLSNNNIYLLTLSSAPISPSSVSCPPPFCNIKLDCYESISHFINTGFCRCQFGVHTLPPLLLPLSTCLLLPLLSPPLLTSVNWNYFIRWCLQADVCINFEQKNSSFVLTNPYLNSASLCLLTACLLSHPILLTSPSLPWLPLKYQKLCGWNILINCWNILKFWKLETILNYNYNYAHPLLSFVMFHTINWERSFNSNLNSNLNLKYV